MKLPIDYLWQGAREPSKWLMVVLHGRGDVEQMPAPRSRLRPE
jgi:hypothetical protein